MINDWYLSPFFSAVVRSQATPLRPIGSRSAFSFLAHRGVHRPGAWTKAVCPKAQEYPKSSLTSYLGRSFRLARRALMIRATFSSVFSVSCIHEQEVAPNCFWPAATAWFDLRMLHVFNRPTAWITEGGRASSNDTPCFRLLLCAFRSPNRTSIMYIQ